MVLKDDPHFTCPDVLGFMPASVTRSVMQFSDDGRRCRSVLEFNQRTCDLLGMSVEEVQDLLRAGFSKYVNVFKGRLVSLFVRVSVAFANSKSDIAAILCPALAFLLPLVCLSLWQYYRSPACLTRFNRSIQTLNILCGDLCVSM